MFFQAGSGISWYEKGLVSYTVDPVVDLSVSIAHAREHNSLTHARKHNSLTRTHITHSHTHNSLPHAHKHNSLPHARKQAHNSLTHARARARLSNDVTTACLVKTLSVFIPTRLSISFAHGKNVNRLNVQHIYYIIFL